MTQTYTRRAPAPAARAQTAETAPGPELAALAAGAPPSAPQTGRRVDLPEGIREKMESSFGADFSNVKLYESQTVAEAGARAVTQGANIAFAPGELDLVSTAGQALLGHELSHVVSQARGESVGRGFLNDQGLEAQADRQGMLAARGESAYAGPVSPVSTSSAASASGPMQAKKKKDAPAQPEAPTTRTDMTPRNVEKNGMSEDYARGLTELLDSGADIPDSALNDELMEEVAQKAGQHANAKMKALNSDNWGDMSNTGFRSSHSPYQVLMNAIAYRKLQGGKDENGNQRHLLTNAISMEQGAADQNVQAVGDMISGNDSVRNMLTTYGYSAFAGDPGHFSPEKQSAMIMHNLTTGLAGNMMKEDMARGDGNKDLTNKGKAFMRSLSIEQVNGKGTGNGKTEASSKYLGRLAGALTPIDLDEWEKEEQEKNTLDIDDLDEVVDLDDMDWDKVEFE